MRKKLTFNDENSTSSFTKHARSQNTLVRLGIAPNPAVAQKIYVAIIIGGVVVLLGLLLRTTGDTENTQPPRNTLPSSVNT